MNMTKRLVSVLSAALLVVLVASTVPSPVVADAAEVTKLSNFGWSVFDGESNFVNAVNTVATLVETNSETEVLILEVHWELPEGAPHPTRAQITDNADQGIICLVAAPYFTEILTPSGKGTTICRSFE